MSNSTWHYFDSVDKRIPIHVTLKIEFALTTRLKPKIGIVMFIFDNTFMSYIRNAITENVTEKH